MHRGYIKVWRKTIESPIWQMPPLYQRVWDWILLSVNHEEQTIYTPKGTISVLPGQRITSLRQIADEVSWYEYGVKRTPNVKTITDILSWLSSNAMCTVESNAKGTIISVANWDTYNQNCATEVTQSIQPEVTESKQRPDTNKNDKNEKKKQEDLKDSLADDKSSPPSALLNLWNEIVDAPKASAMSKAREAKCRLRLKERSTDEWADIFKRINTTPFLRGEGGGWRASFDWIISNDTNSLKVLEGKYDDRLRSSSSTSETGRKKGIPEPGGPDTDWFAGYDNVPTV